MLSAKALLYCAALLQHAAKAAAQAVAADATCAGYPETSTVESGPMDIDYLYFHYCTMHGLPWLSGLLLLCWIVALIYLLCHTADNYFSPTLAAICDRLDLSPEVAGVTWLAFGNGGELVLYNFM
jgi:hypothetical protein